MLVACFNLNPNFGLDVALRYCKINLTFMFLLFFEAPLGTYAFLSVEFF